MFLALKGPSMMIGNWTNKLDHARISLSCYITPTTGEEPCGLQWSIPQPRLINISSDDKARCKEEICKALNPLLMTLRTSDRMNAMEADKLSQTLAETAIKIATDIFGGKKPTHEKRKYESFDMIKTQAEINTIEKTRDLIRTLYLDEVTSMENRQSLENHLSTLLDRLIRMGLHSVPLQHDLKSLHEWSQSTAKADIESLRKYMESQKSDMDAAEKQRQNEMFLNPKKKRTMV